MHTDEPSSERTVKPSNTPEGEFGGFLAPFGIQLPTDILQLALTHRSWAFENDGAPHNERLEFLGDSILGQAVTVKLFRDFPELSEGDLAKRRAALVSSAALAEIARRIELGPELRLGVGEERTGGREKDSILADAVEAVIGAVFIAAGAAVAEAFVLQLIEPLLADPERFTISLDPKTSLQEEASARGVPHPTYETVGEGPDHDRVYTARVTLEQVTGTGSGTSKKAAELAAARHALQQIYARRAARERRKRGNGAGAGTGGPPENA